MFGPRTVWGRKGLMVKSPANVVAWKSSPRGEKKDVSLGMHLVCLDVAVCMRPAGKSSAISAAAIPRHFSC